MNKDLNTLTYPKLKVKAPFNKGVAESRGISFRKPINLSFSDNTIHNRGQGFLRHKIKLWLRIKSAIPIR